MAETYLFTKLFLPNTFYLANSPNINLTKHSRYTVIVHFKSTAAQTSIYLPSTIIVNNATDWYSCFNGISISLGSNFRMYIPAFVDYTDAAKYLYKYRYHDDVALLL